MSRQCRVCRYRRDINPKPSFLPFIYCPIAQLAERVTVNHDVAGSNPAGAAKARIGSAILDWVEGDTEQKENLKTNEHTQCSAESLNRP